MGFLPKLCLITALTGSSQTVPPTVSNAFDVAPQAAGNLGQLNPAIAFDGVDTYLVVWEEGWDALGKDTNIVCARIKADGSVLDPGGIPLCKAADFQERPAVAHAGGQWLVVWQDLRNGKDYDIFGARVSAGGAVLDPGGVALFAFPLNQCQPVVASNGTDFCVAWSDFRHGRYNVNLGRVGADASPLGNEVLAAAPGDPGTRKLSPLIVWNGSHWLVEWYSSGSGVTALNGPYAALWSSDLKTVGSAVYLSDTSPPLHHPTLAIDGNRALSAWSGNWLGRGRPCPLTGLLIDGSNVKPLPTLNAAYPPWPDARGTRPERFPLSRDAAPIRHVVAAASDGLFLIVSQSRTFNKPDSQATPHNGIAALRIRASDGLSLDGSGSNSQFITISAGTSVPQRNPAVAGGKGGQFLVVYEADRGINNRRLEARFLQAK